MWEQNKSQPLGTLTKVKQDAGRAESGNKRVHSLNLKRIYGIIDIYIYTYIGGLQMAKKIVRGITDVKTINNQDFDTNNVNDLLSDGQYNYIHRKKGKNEEYHNLTDNIKTISSDNTELLSVTNYNKTTNTATLHPKHDKQKEQLLESTRNTVTIHHGENGTAEKTTVDTNPQKVLEHENLKTGDGLTTSFNTDETTIMFKATRKAPETNINTLGEGIIRGNNFSKEQVPSGDQAHSAAYITINTTDNTKVQLYIRESGPGNGKIRLYYRFIKNGEVTEWKKMVGDNDDLNNQLTQKQNKLTTNSSIGVVGTGLCQLYGYEQSYSHTNGLLKTHVKSVSSNSSVGTLEQEFNFILKINQGYQDVTFTLNEHDKTKFKNITSIYGTGNTVRINGCLFTLSDATLTVTTDANTGSNQVITFSYII